MQSHHTAYPLGLNWLRRLEEGLAPVSCSCEVHSTRGGFNKTLLLPPFLETGPIGPGFEGQQVEVKSKAVQTKPKKLIRRIGAHARVPEYLLFLGHENVKLSVFFQSSME